MAERIREFDWSHTAIGPVKAWSAALRTTVSILLANRFPMLLWWGPEYVSIYNDAYRPILGQKHPWGLGRPVRECWSEIWHVLKPLIDTPFHGGPASWSDDIELEINRAGFMEETHFTIAYSPVPDETAPGGIGGVLATVHEITEKVVGERRVRILRDLGTHAAEAKTAEESCQAAAATLADHAKDIPFALFYLLDGDNPTARLAATCGVKEGTECSPEAVNLEDDSASIWPFGAARRAEQMQVVEKLAEKFSDTPAGPWADAPQQAAVIPIRSSVPHQFSGFWVAGLSARMRLDDGYWNFLELATAQIGTAIANARAYGEERKRAEALAEVDRAKTIFFSNVSHEFRTPLTLMMGPLETLLANDGIAGEEREQISTAYRNSMRLLKLVNSLLDYSRIEAGRAKASFEPVDLPALTTDLASNFRSTIESAGVKLMVDCPPLPQPVYVDRDMWEKIVLNLLSNAFKFTFAGSIAVKIEADENYARLIVRDTGAGIPEAEQPHIFERFHRVEGARGRTYEGTGIGLALILELVKLHGGSIKVESRLNEGSSFTIAIPFGKEHLASEQIGPAAVNQAATSGRAQAFINEALNWLARKRIAGAGEELPVEPHAADAGRRWRVLLADDNADMRQHVMNILESHYDVTAVSDGRAALEEARSKPPDLILTDVMMPVLDGFGLLRALREDRLLRETPVILISARAGEEARTEGISAGADDYVTKPFNARELMARVETTLRLQEVRREARTQLERSMIQFETLLNQAPIGVYLVDADLRIRQVNPTARKFFGEETDPIGRDFPEAIHAVWPEGYANELVKLFRNALEEGQSHIMTERIETQWDKDVKESYELHINRIPLPDGRFGVVCYFRDIAEQVRAREEILRSEQRFRAFVTASSDAIYRMSPDWSEMRHLQGRDFIADTSDPNRSWLDKYIHPDDQAEVMSAIHDAIRSKAPFEKEHRVIRVDGSLGWTFSRAVPILDRSGQIVEWFGTARDVTERRRSEHTLRQLTERSDQLSRLYQTILSSTPDLVYVFDLNHRFTYANEALLAMWGKTAEEAIGKNCLELGYEPWHAEMHDREIEQVIAAKQPVRGEVPFTGTNGRRIYDYIFVPVLGVSGEVEAIAGTTRDMTERKATEDELRRANQDLEQFAYSASHDLQEPLRSVKIYSELLAEQCKDKLDHESEKFLRFLRSGATRMETLVRDLLEYTQVTKVDTFTEPASANDALSAALSNLARAIAESGARVTADQLPQVPVHATHLQQLFQNLISNAIKYRSSTRAPEVHVSAKRQEGRWTFTVQDNGIGIDPEYKETIFGLFKRLHTSHQYSGTGIGLAICQRIVDRYNGRIWVESKPGLGSAFRFTLPV